MAGAPRAARLDLAVGARSPVVGNPATSAAWQLEPVPGGGGLTLAPSETVRWFFFARAATAWT
jgi:hypothetical protein